VSVAGRSLYFSALVAQIDLRADLMNATGNCKSGHIIGIDLTDGLAYVQFVTGHEG
jgi:hypothetical protein